LIVAADYLVGGTNGRQRFKARVDVGRESASLT